MSGGVFEKLNNLLFKKRMNGCCTHSSEGRNIRDILRTRIPIVKTQMTIAKTKMPIVKTQMSLAKTKMPIVKTQMPIAKTQMPIAKTRMPIAKTQMPIVKTRMPIAKTHVRALLAGAHPPHTNAHRKNPNVQTQCITSLPKTANTHPPNKNINHLLSNNYPQPKKNTYTCRDINLPSCGVNHTRIN